MKLVTDWGRPAARGGLVGGWVAALWRGVGLEVLVSTFKDELRDVGRKSGQGLHKRACMRARLPE